MVNLKNEEKLQNIFTVINPIRKKNKFIFGV